jgi:uncharacterized alpha-E superfamily protein
MDPQTYQLIDTIIKIGFGAAIAGLFSYITIVKNHSNETKKNAAKDKVPLVRELSLKIENIEKHANSSALKFLSRDTEAAKEFVVNMANEAYAARAISNLIGNDLLFEDLEKICLIVEELFLEISKDTPDLDKISQFDIGIKNIKIGIYPHIRTAYAEANI